MSPGRETVINNREHLMPAALCPATTAAGHCYIKGVASVPCMDITPPFARKPTALAVGGMANIDIID